MIEAKINSAGTHIVCGKPCGARLASVICGSGGGVHPLTSDTGQTPLRTDHLTAFGGETTHDGCNIVAAPGWLRNEQTGVWELTRHAQKQLQRDQWLASGNGHDPREAERARNRLQEGRSTAFRQSSSADLPPTGGAARQVRHRIELPAQIRCPDCTAINQVSDALRVDAITRHRDRTSV